MNAIEGSVSLHPYFKVHTGKLDAAKLLLREFVAKTTTEAEVLYYEFTINGDEVYCREAYTPPASGRLSASKPPKTLSAAGGRAEVGFPPGIQKPTPARLIRPTVLDGLPLIAADRVRSLRTNWSAVVCNLV